jgi:hypothetical protein
VDRALPVAWHAATVRRAASGSSCAHHTMVEQKFKENMGFANLAMA